MCFQATFFCIRNIKVINKCTSPSLHGSAGKLSSGKYQAVLFWGILFCSFEWFWRCTHHCRCSSDKGQWSLTPCNADFPGAQREVDDSRVVWSSPASLELGHLSSTGLWAFAILRCHLSDYTAAVWLLMKGEKNKNVLWNMHSSINQDVLPPS